MNTLQLTLEYEGRLEEVLSLAENRVPFEGAGAVGPEFRGIARFGLAAQFEPRTGDTACLQISIFGNAATAAILEPVIVAQVKKCYRMVLSMAELVPTRDKDGTPQIGIRPLDLLGEHDRLGRQFDRNFLSTHGDMVRYFCGQARRKKRLGEATDRKLFGILKIPGGHISMSFPYRILTKADYAEIQRIKKQRMAERLKNDREAAAAREPVLKVEIPQLPPSLPISRRDTGGCIAHAIRSGN